MTTAGLAEKFVLRACTTGYCVGAEEGYWYHYFRSSFEEEARKYSEEKGRGVFESRNWVVGRVYSLEMKRVGKQYKWTTILLEDRCNDLSY